MDLDKFYKYAGYFFAIITPVFLFLFFIDRSFLTTLFLLLCPVFSFISFRKSRKITHDYEHKVKAAEEQKQLEIREKEEQLERQKLLQVEKEKALISPIFFDTETTGVRTDGYDEVLSLSIVDRDGKVLFSQFIKPSHRKRWTKAEDINGITPEMVKQCKTIDVYITQIQEIFNHASIVIGYNTEFDLSFLRNVGLVYDGYTADVMLDFARVAGDWSNKYGDYKWKKLTQCARYYKYNWGKNAAHNSTEDTLATRFCFYKMLETSGMASWTLRRQ